MNEQQKEYKEILENTPSGKDLYDQKKKEKEKSKKSSHRKEKIGKAPKKVGKWILYIAITVTIISGIVWLFSITPKLPPTSMENHIESSPPAHIVSQPIPENIQRHMLEHADGGKSPGIIIQYNCDDHACAPDLVEKLTALVNEYPDNVYLAPNKYDGKVILTKLGRREILDNFDEQSIRSFIEGRQINIDSQEASNSSEVSEKESADDSVIKIESGSFFFSPNVITAKVGKSIKIDVIAEGTHTFTIDELGVNELTPHGTTTRIEFTPDKKGTFEIYCAVVGHRGEGQVGTIVVE